MHRRRHGTRRRVASSLMLSAACVAGPLQATWSIAAVDRDAGQVGVAGASCTFNVQGISEIVPGKGAVVVQARSSGAARKRGIELMEQGATAKQIVKAMRDQRFDPENQQYAVITLDPEHSPRTYSGKQISDWSGSETGDDVTVQGNILVSEQVVAAALAAYQSAQGKMLAVRLTEALVAGAEAGGDRRCGEQHARSAFVSVFDADDNLGTPYLHLSIFGIRDDGEPAVALLAERFEDWQTQGTDQKSTRLYVIP